MRNLARRSGGGETAPLLFLHLGEMRVLLVSSPEAAREVTKTHDITFATRPRTISVGVVPLDEVGIMFAPYGDYWRQLRKICTQELLSTKRVKSYRHIRQEEVANLVDSIYKSEGQLFDLSARLSAYVTDTTVRVILGDRFKYRDEFLEMLDEGVKVCLGLSLVDLFPSSWLARLLSNTERRARRHWERLFGLIETVIREHEESKAGGGGGGAPSQDEGEDHDMIDVLLRVRKEGGGQIPLTMPTIHSTLADLFGAGSETAAATLQWAMAELLRNPRIMKKAQDEVRQMFKGETKVNEERLCELQYLPLVIKETLRLRPAATILMPRECQEECQILGYDVPKGTMVIVNAWAITTDPKYWEDPEEFKPERFESNNIDYYKGMDHEFLPFGSGRRICPGALFALANVEIALASLLFHFDWELPTGVQPHELDMTETMGVSTKLKSNLLVHARPFAPMHTAP